MKQILEQQKQELQARIDKAEAQAKQANEAANIFRKQMKVLDKAISDLPSDPISETPEKPVDLIKEVLPPKE